MYTMHRNPCPSTPARSGEPAVPFVCCPIHAAIGVLGKKWTLLILRDIALKKITRFNQIRRSLPGLTPGSLPCGWRNSKRMGSSGPGS